MRKERKIIKIFGNKNKKKQIQKINNEHRKK